MYGENVHRNPRTALDVLKGGKAASHVAHSCPGKAPDQQWVCCLSQVQKVIGCDSAHLALYED
jgi:hypothetical protein